MLDLSGSYSLDLEIQQKVYTKFKKDKHQLAICVLESSKLAVYPKMCPRS